MENVRTLKKNDIIVAIDGNKQTLTHMNGQFTPVIRDCYNPLDKLVEIYPSDKFGLRIMLDTVNAYYFVVRGVAVLGQPYNTFEKAVEMLHYWTEHYQDWISLQSMKGLSKKKFLEEVKEGNLTARLTYTNMKGRPTDDCLYPLTKTKGRGSVDIVRDDKISAIFNIDSLPSFLMVYTGDKLKIFSSGYRLYNEKEIQCVTDWEKHRDRKAEWIDAISDGSQEFYRRKDFFESRGCSHLRHQTYSLLVKDHNFRQMVILEYDIKRK